MYNSKVHGANMGPIWGRQDPGGPHVGPMNFAIWEVFWDRRVVLPRYQGIDYSRWSITPHLGTSIHYRTIKTHDDVIKWKHFPRHWPFVRGIHRSPVNSPYKGQWRGALMFSLICVWASGWANNRDAGDLRHHRAHYDVTVMPLPTLLHRLICYTQQRPIITQGACPPPPPPPPPPLAI